MTDRNPARLAAPLALLAAVVAIVVVVGASGKDSSSSTKTATRTAVTQPARPARRAAPRSYVVKPGDTLTVISEETGVSLETIQRLNPDVDPQALQTGRRLRLSP